MNTARCPLHSSLRCLPVASLLSLLAAAPAMAWPFALHSMGGMTGQSPRIAAFQAKADRPLEFAMGSLYMRVTSPIETYTALPLPDPDPYVTGDPNVNFSGTILVTGDVDGDGDTDIVEGCGVYYGSSVTPSTDDFRIMVSLNDGQGNYARGWQWKGHSSTEGVPVVHLADMDNDGDLDLVDGFDTVRVRWNPGNGDFGTSSQVLDSINLRGGRREFVSGDFNRDGLTDLAAFGNHRVPVGGGYEIYGRSILYSGKPGGGYTVTILATLPKGDEYFQAEAEDLDRDGLVDLVFSRRALPSSIAWMRNNGAGFDATATLIFLPDYDIAYFAFADFDEDGRRDIAYSAAYKKLAWARATGPATFGPEQILYSGSDVQLHPGSLVAADYDADGDVDLLFNSGLRLLENTALHARPQASRLSWAGTSPGAGTVDLHTAYITADARQDLIATDPAGERILIYPGGNSTLTSPLILSTAGDDPAAVAAGDIDGDGKTDLAWTSGSAVKWARNVNGTGIGWAAQTALTLAGADQLVAADADGDADVDLLVSSATSGTVRWLLNDGTGTAWTQQTVATSVPGVKRLAAGQTIPGGRPEVELVLTSSSNNSAWRRYGYSGSAWSLLTTVDALPSPPVFASTGLAIGGFFSDGCQPASAYKSGAMGGGISVRPGNTLADLSDRVLNISGVDWNNDGYEDLLSAGDAGVVIHTQAPEQPSAKWIRVNTPELSSIEMADAVPFDLNHDARMDAVSVESGTGKLHLIYNNSTAISAVAEAVVPGGTPLKIMPGTVSTAVKLTVNNWGRSTVPAGQSPDAAAVPENCEFVFRRAVVSGSGYIPGPPLTDAEINAVVKTVRFANANSVPAGTSSGRFTLPLNSFVQTAQAVLPGTLRTFALGLEIEDTALSAPVTRFFLDIGGAAASPPRWFPQSTAGVVGPVPLNVETRFPVTPSVLVEITAATPLQQWRMAHFNTYDGVGSAANDADPDRDGVPNLVEYVTGRNPKSAAASEAAESALRLISQPAPLPVLADTVLTNSYDPAVRVTIEKSSDLTTWSDFAWRKPDGTWSGSTPFLFALSGGRTRFLFSTGVMPPATPVFYARLKVSEIP